MQVEIRGQGVELNEAAMGRLTRRVDFALGRLGAGVSRVWVHLAGAGPAKRCRVLVRLAGRPDVLAEDADADLGRAIERTVHKAGLAARRSLLG
jgi:hypothetical protein